MAFISFQPFHAQNVTTGRWSGQQAAKTKKRSSHIRAHMSLDRRACLKQLLAVCAGLSSAPLLHANAAMYSADTKSAFTITGDPKKLDSYMPQIEAGYKALSDLRDNWEKNTKDYDGDVVRRVLGTVGVKSPLFNIRKSLLKSWQIVSETSPDDELVERLESEWNDVVNGIASIDFQLYSVSFTELTESKESLITQGKKALDDTILVYGNMLKDFRAAT